MDQYRDERIVCVDCGSSFVFTAAEAAHFAERGLSAPPKRCRDCRRARKEQQQGGGRGPNGFAPRGDARGGRTQGGGGSYTPRAGYGWTYGEGGERMPSHTGNVNEYRSPMQVGPSHAQSEYRGPMHAGAQGSQSEYRGPMQGGPNASQSEYRSPMQGGYGGRGPARHRSRGPRVAAVDDGNYRAPSFGGSYEPQRAQGRRSDRGGGPPRGEARAREMFSITCKSCGAESQVPFRPDEGRDVFCQACYRARKPG